MLEDVLEKIINMEKVDDIDLANKFRAKTCERRIKKK